MFETLRDENKIDDKDEIETFKFNKGIRNFNVTLCRRGIKVLFDFSITCLIPLKTKLEDFDVRTICTVKYRVGGQHPVIRHVLRGLEL